MLTPRDLEYLRMIAYPNKEIAYRWEIRPQSVKNGFSRIYTKLGVRSHDGSRSRIKALMVVLLRGWIEIDDIEWPYSNDRY